MDCLLKQLGQDTQNRTSSTKRGKCLQVLALLSRFLCALSVVLRALRGESCVLPVAVPALSSLLAAAA